MTTRRFLNDSGALARTVRDERASKGLSQADLGKRAEVDADFVADLEEGRPSGEVDKILRVLDVLDVHALALPSVAPGIKAADVDLDKVIRRFE